MLKLLTYDSLLAEASEYILSLPETKQKELKENLSHGKALLKSKDQMKAYLHHYGQMHREKLLRAYKHIPSDFLKSSFSVIDWGCGQGLASMVLSEYVPNEDIVTDFILIEPSVLCLSQANANLTWSNPKSMVDVLRKREEEVEATDICVQERKVLHLLSNVVDMPEFSGNGIRRFVFVNINLNHLIIGVSPFYPEEGRGKRMDEFAESLNGFKKVYSFQKHIDDWDKNYSCQIRVLSNRLTPKGEVFENRQYVHIV